MRKKMSIVAVTVVTLAMTLVGQAWIRQETVPVMQGVVLERAALESSAQEVVGGCETFTGARAICWNVWLQSDDGATRLRLLRVSGPNSEFYARRYATWFNVSQELLLGVHINRAGGQ